MSNPIIRVTNLGKRYYIGITPQQREKHSTLVGKIIQQTTGTLRRMSDSRLARAGTDEVEELWALKNISFELQKGDVLGIIGQNGSGKSTLLKIISHITAPSEGQVDLYGRVGSLLEVGTGFHPDLTGRENIYMNGAIHGMKRVQVDRIFDEIVDFSGVEHFIDTQVKYYSSGMFVRLAFSVAAHLDPEILILDEVLAVGDAIFQRKSMERMEKIAKSGRTVLFVSHGMASITRLCNQAIYLDHGQIISAGLATDVVSEYLKRINKINEERLSKDEKNVAFPPFLDIWNSDARRDGYSKRILSHISIHRLDGSLCTEFKTGDSMRIRIGYRLEQDMIAYCQINFLDYAATRVMQLHSTHGAPPFHLRKGEGEIECTIHDLRLLGGNYIVMLDFGDASRPGHLDWIDCIGDTLHIKVVLGDYLGGVGLGLGQVVFAQRSEWKTLP